MSNELLIAILSLIATVVLGLPGFILNSLQLNDRRKEETGNSTNGLQKSSTTYGFSRKKQLLFRIINFIFNFIGTNILVNQVWFNDSPVTRITIFWIGLGFSIIVITFVLPFIVGIYNFLDSDI